MREHRAFLSSVRSESVVSAAAAAVWNLSAHEGVKSLVIKEKGIEALVMQLRESDSPEVWHKCAGCLMVLAANSDKVKTLVGDESGISALTDIIKRAEHNKAVSCTPHLVQSWRSSANMSATHFAMVGAQGSARCAGCAELR